MVRYFGISKKDGGDFVVSRQPGSSISPIPVSTVQKSKGQGDLFDIGVVEELVTRVQRMKREMSGSDGRMNGSGGRFDADLAVLVHQTFSDHRGQAEEMLADPDFWRWIAIAKFYDVIAWRFPGKNDSGVNPSNFGIGPDVENLLYRSWLRGEMAREPGSSDPYRLVRVTDVDLWRSHILRIDYAAAREVARALLRLQARDETKIDLDVLRELAKLLRRRRSNVLFELYDRAQADQLMQDLIPDAKRNAEAEVRRKADNPD
jgi:hypothetical protein